MNLSESKRLNWKHNASITALKLLIILCLFAYKQNCQCIIYIYTLWFIIYWIRDKKISEAEAFILYHTPASRCNLSDGKKQKIKPQGSILRAWEPKINVHLKLAEKHLHKAFGKNKYKKKKQHEVMRCEAFLVK